MIIEILKTLAYAWLCWWGFWKVFDFIIRG